MASKIYSFGLEGVEPFLVTIECSVLEGNTRFEIIGLPDMAVKESRERIQSAIMALGMDFPYKHIVMNLAPANVRKSGSIYDIALLISLLIENCDIPQREIAVLGELSLGGEIRGIRGVLPMILEAEKLGVREIIIPKSNAQEGTVCKGVKVYVAENVQEVLDHLRGRRSLTLAKDMPTIVVKDSFPLDFAEVKGQALAKKSLEIAAAGGHNLLMIGPPGSGKSMLAKRLPSILPKLSDEEQLSTTKIYSVSGLLGENTGLVTTRPFRSPHHNISPVGLIGGGSPLRPGEISLAHNGVLFLDELPEFPVKVIDSLRQPLEDGQITIARVSSRVTFPSQIMLIAAMNPCPCGYYGEPRCTCSPKAVQRYLQRISGPMLDRFDIHTTVDSVSYEDLQSKSVGESSAEILKRVTLARAIQEERYKGTAYQTNSQIGRDILEDVCRLDSAAQSLMKLAFDRLGLSARGHDKLLKLARTIADLEGSKDIKSGHVGQAVQLRRLDRRL